MAIIIGLIFFILVINSISSLFESKEKKIARQQRHAQLEADYLNWIDRCKEKNTIRKLKEQEELQAYKLKYPDKF